MDDGYKPNPFAQMDVGNTPMPQQDVERIIEEFMQRRERGLMPQGERDKLELMKRGTAPWYKENAQPTPRSEMKESPWDANRG